MLPGIGKQLQTKHLISSDEGFLHSRSSRSNFIFTEMHRATEKMGDGWHLEGS